jgi:hypothetical protein
MKKPRRRYGQYKRLTNNNLNPVERGRSKNKIKGRRLESLPLQAKLFLKLN